MGIMQNLMAGSLMNEIGKSFCSPNVRYNTCPLHYVVKYHDAMAFVLGFHVHNAC